MEKKGRRVAASPFCFLPGPKLGVVPFLAELQLGPLLLLAEP